MDQKSLKPVRQRRSYTPELKAELVAQYLQGDDSGGDWVGLGWRAAAPP
ncbi:MAG: transposase [Burkholderiaceae bacterium]|nr:transposase [Burkholderiaceae bacterium]